jgi:hypothetical protein
MILQSGCLKRIIVTPIEKLMLPFIPVCDITKDITLPFLPGSRVVQVSFIPALEEKAD